MANTNLDHRPNFGSVEDHDLMKSIYRHCDRKDFGEMPFQALNTRL